MASSEKKMIDFLSAYMGNKLNIKFQFLIKHSYILATQANAKAKPNLNALNIY